MTNPVTHQQINNSAQLKAEIIEQTIRNLLEENDGTFDLTTPSGIQSAVNYTVDYLMLNKIKVNEIVLKDELIRHLPATKEKQ
ncbi:hypothetical protein [Acinetobacter baumannii]|uniref:hypothetical protein n=1 Tax=Acinetobacter baumannii TaxID=470 RepID=UPI002AD73C7C|nr:hypothetical protein [Acinetobacter baumannii]